MLTLVELGENDFNQKTGQSVASIFFAFCTTGTKPLTPPIPPPQLKYIQFAQNRNHAF